MREKGGRFPGGRGGVHARARACVCGYGGEGWGIIRRGRSAVRSAGLHVHRQRRMRIGVQARASWIRSRAGEEREFREGAKRKHLGFHRGPPP